MASSVYTFVGTSNSGNNDGAILLASGRITQGQSGLFLPSEYQAALASGIVLKAGPAFSPAPQLTAPGLGLSSSGSPNGTYIYAVTFVTAAGETMLGPEATFTVTNAQVNINAIPVGNAVSGVIARKIYRTVAGQASGSEKLLTTLNDNTTTIFTDNVADGSLGPAAPTSDTAGVFAGTGPSTGALPPTGVSSFNARTGIVVLSRTDISGTGFASGVDLVPTAVNTAANSPVAANPGDLVVVDTTQGAVTVQLPSVPGDQSSIGVFAQALGLDASGLAIPATVLSGVNDAFINGQSVDLLNVAGQVTVYTYPLSTGRWNALAAVLPISGLDQRYLVNPQITGLISSPKVQVTGVAGETTPINLIGRWNYSGPPLTGPHKLGDAGWDGSNPPVFYICSTAGTPGLFNGLPPTLPTVVTGAVDGLTQTTVNLNGTVNPNGTAATAYFEYGPTTSYGTQVPVPPGDPIAGDKLVHSYANSLSGLTANTPYHYRLTAINAGGTASGSDATFTTQPVASPPPTATTNVATLATQTTVTLNATVNPNGASTTVQFEYGTTTGYGTTAPVSAFNIGSGSSPVAYSTGLTGLTANTLYHFRINATNANGGPVHGADQTFQTVAVASSPPTVETDPATLVSQTTASLNALVNPNGSATTFFFQYGIGTAFNLSAPAGPINIGSASTPQGLGTSVTGLTPNTTYQFRAVATNSAGTIQGANLSFTTQAASVAPTAITNPATSIGQGAANLNGSSNPNGQDTTVQFEYGLTTGYGTTIPAVASDIGSGTSAVAFSVTVSGLTAGTLYHFRFNATNATAPTHGADQTFTTSPAPAANLVKFARQNSVGPSGAATDISHGVLVYSLPPSTTIASTISSIKSAATAAGKTVKVLAYQAFDITQSSGDPNGFTGSITYATAQASNLLATDVNGHHIYFGSFTTDMLLDITLTATRNAIAAHSKSICSTYGFDGIWYDDVDTFLPNMKLKALVGSAPASTDPSTTPTWGSTSSALEDAMAAAVAAVVPQLRDAGLICVGNMATVSNNTGKTINAVERIGPILAGSPPNGGGLYMESFTDGGAGLDQQLTVVANLGSGNVSADQANMQHCVDMDSQGIAYWVNTQNTTSAGQIYALACMMLCTTGFLYYVDDYFTGSHWATAGNLTPFTAALNSGAAIDPPVTPGTPNGTGADTGLYVRRFTNCTVRLNLTHSTTINGLTGLTGAGPYATIA